MKICGISIKSNVAIICVIEQAKTSIKIVQTSMKKISLDDETNQESIKSFFKVFNSFINVNNIDVIAIKARQHKGPFAGGSISFKIESLIQLTENKVEIIPAQTISSRTKEITIPSEIHKYQEEAFKAACALLDK